MFVNGEADAKLVAKGHTVVVHGIGGWESEEVEDLLHVLVLGIFEDAISCVQIPTYHVARLVLENRKPFLSCQLFGYSAFHAVIRREQTGIPTVFWS